MTQAYKTYDNYHNEYGRQYICPAEHIYVRSSVYLPNSEIDPRTGLLKPDIRRIGRTQAKRLEYAGLDKEYKQLDIALKAREEVPGSRITVRTAILVVFISVFIVILLILSQHGKISSHQKKLNRMDKDIQQYEKIIDETINEISEATDAVNICYIAARDLNMIPAESAEAIYLVALDTRPSQAGGIFANNENQLIIHEAYIQTDIQETSVPAMAYAGIIGSDSK